MIGFMKTSIFNIVSCLEIEQVVVKGLVFKGVFMISVFDQYSALLEGRILMKTKTVIPLVFENDLSFFRNLTSCNQS